MCLKRLKALHEKMLAGCGDGCIPTDFNNVKNGIANLLHNCTIPKESPYPGILLKQLIRGLNNISRDSRPMPISFDTLSSMSQEGFTQAVLGGKTSFYRMCFEECNFRGTEFSESLRQFNFTDCCFSSCTFVDCDLTGTRFFNATLSGCEFQRTNLTEANCRYSCIYYSRFHGCNLTLADFQQSSLSHNRFMDCTFDKASFIAATLDSTEFDRTVSASGIAYPELARITMGGAADMEVENYRRRVYRDLFIGPNVKKPEQPATEKHSRNDRQER